MSYTCPACGYPNLQEEPRGKATGGSYEICPSCGIQFGLDDEAGGNLTRRLELYRQWRQEWTKQGMPWRSVGAVPPKDWDPIKQVRDLIK
jgi:hypothetical protein